MFAFALLLRDRKETARDVFKVNRCIGWEFFFFCLVFVIFILLPFGAIFPYHSSDLCALKLVFVRPASCKFPLEVMFVSLSRQANKKYCCVM